RKLLWHGSRVCNMMGILSQGLKVAPVEANSTGYMFGKGIYFADAFCKSIGYCSTSAGYACLLLCEVA
ncbi:Poly polymerase, partial [Gaertneriomyces semiglobifer]